jgi:hypothetical protein
VSGRRERLSLAIPEHVLHAPHPDHHHAGGRERRGEDQAQGGGDPENQREVDADEPEFERRQRADREHRQDAAMTRRFDLARLTPHHRPDPTATSPA